MTKIIDNKLFISIISSWVTCITGIAIVLIAVYTIVIIICRALRMASQARKYAVIGCIGMTI